MNVYFDNAATTNLDPLVLKEMLTILEGKNGNPSSIHSYGREAKAIVEKARKNVAKFLNCSPSEIFFTSGGTEADNMAIRSAVEAYNIRHIITSPLEHHAVLHSIEDLEKKGLVKVSHVKLHKNGHVDLAGPGQLLAFPGSKLPASFNESEHVSLLPLVSIKLSSRVSASIDLAQKWLYGSLQATNFESA